MCCDLKHFLDNKPLVKYVTATKDIQMIESVFNMFSEHAVPKLASFRTGAVHNDLNCENLLCIKGRNGNFLKLSGVIDMMDATVSYSVFDGAVCMAFCMMKDCTNPLEYSLPVMCGYLNNCSPDDEEFSCLYYLVAARLTQSYLHALHSQTVDPDNLYRTRSLHKSYAVLKQLLSNPKQEVDNMWRKAQFKSF